MSGATVSGTIHAHTPTLTSGSHTLGVKDYDAAGNSASAQVSVSASNETTRIPLDEERVTVDVGFCQPRGVSAGQPGPQGAAG